MSERTPPQAGEGTSPPTPTGGGFRWEAITPFLCLAGLGIAAYLTAMHFNVFSGDLSLGAACGEKADCNSVVSSRYATLLGLPVSVWGILYYIVTGTLSLGALLMRREDRAAFVRGTLWLTIAALAVDAWLAWAMTMQIGRLCTLCVATWAVNLMILLVTLEAARGLRGVPATLGSLLPGPAGLRDPGAPAYYREALKAILATLAAGACLLVLVATLVYSRAIVDAQKGELADLLEFLRKEPPVAIPTRGLPARGPEGAPISIVVFSDFMCEQCKRASKYFDIVAAHHRDSLRIAYASVPADRACNPGADRTAHPRACEVARAGACARRQGRFWQFHDVVFADPGSVRAEKIPTYARRAGLDPAAFDACMAQGDSASGLLDEIAVSRAVGVTATPTSYINGRPVVGALNPWMLEAAIQALRSEPATRAARR